ncbi:MAG: putative ATP-dependent endonuclease of the OLD family [Candidatus Saganbacteria bacterium]|uniref:Putative ATP-dependent endonuclease of the OLD family n=1 Tax=Candidatus Saganbacteria bacterium TaxID=2575572 RepID=A0A833L3D1_UNCSA|nr:MAG: putative ATP-dependent endonuclease of the OLD family [Candidatus Saganbacteria bacterium]
MIKSIKIKNFRSIKDLAIEPSSVCALIGPNSSGKTNILKALDLVIGEGWTTKAKVARELFYDAAQPIVIEVRFNNPIEFTNKRGYEVSISSVKLEMALDPELSAKTTINGNDTFYDQDQFKRLCHFILIPSERHLSSELRVTQWTMLGKLMRLVYENYISHYSGNEQNLKKEFTEKIKPAKDFLEHDFSTNEITFKKFVESFKKHCKENSAGLANEFDPVLDIYNLNWFYKTLQIHVKEDFPDQPFDSEEVGAGMQNLLLVSIFQTYSELMGGKVIFGIEEPEIYLYPQAQRALYRNFIKLSEQTQIFYTTHNPNFVDAGRPEDIVLLRKDYEKGTYKLEKDVAFNAKNAAEQRHKIYTHFNSERNELFFARRVLFVEGDSDKILFTSLCENRWGINLDEKGVSVIECGGKGGVVYFLGVCRLIGFDDYFAVWDKDGNLDNAELLDKAKQDGKGLEFNPKLESVLGLPEGDDAEKVKNAFEWATNITNQVPADFGKVENFLKQSESNSILPEAIEEHAINFKDVPF